ncbi:hypothetical protein POM88_002709 [Heracleum sosnowskyi]|uniref:Uncharacterized protein n=1 Tax=Heracleum sosnowskyi TaxID=360622 RepID=A0AAD8JF78_9APIA|nr:hypothetical protein POM88_002709 [Heracleum sosnowskyi]
MRLKYEGMVVNSAPQPLVHVVAAAAKNKEAAITENVNDIANILEAVVRSEKYEVVRINLEAVICTEPAADVIDRTHSASNRSNDTRSWKASTRNKGDGRRSTGPSECLTRSFPES